MGSAIEVQLQVDIAGGSDAADCTVVRVHLVLRALLCLGQAALVLAAHVVRLQVHCTGGGNVAYGAVVRACNPAAAAVWRHTMQWSHRL